MDPKDSLIFEKGYKNAQTNFIPKLDIECDELEDIITKNFIRDELQIPDIPEVEIVRHYIKLSKTNYGLDSGIYPLGSCTMKYNPKINEHIARLAEFSQIHPLQEENEGALQVIHNISKEKKRSVIETTELSEYMSRTRQITNKTLNVLLKENLIEFMQDTNWFKSGIEFRGRTPRKFKLTKKANSLKSILLREHPEYQV